MSDKKTQGRVFEIIKIVGVTATLVSALWSAIASLTNKLVWQIDYLEDRANIIEYIKENEILRREESICRRVALNDATRYDECREKYERERDLRPQSWLK